MNQFIVDVVKKRWWYLATIPVGINVAGSGGSSLFVCIGGSSLFRHAE